jgi:hypothetical protein
MKYLVTALTLLIAIYSNAATRDTIQANNEFIEYTGRIDFSDSLAPKFSYSGISIRAAFSGTSISAIMDDDLGQNYYNVILDGKVSKTINVTQDKKEYILMVGLKDTIHEIELFKRTELTFGKTQFYGFTVDKGKSLSPITNKRELFIEYIGNSITCGYGNEGTLGEDFLATTENHYLTYAAITSRNFNARHMAVCRSGIGIYRNYDGPSTGNSDCMTNLYSRIFLYDEKPKYDFANQPDLICINLGTNDFSTTGGDSALFVSNYFRLIDTLQDKYNMPQIVCLIGPMLEGNTLTNMRGYLDFIADSASRKGKGNVRVFEMSAQTGDLGIAVHYHPTVAQHTRNANELTGYIKTLMNWDINPLILSAQTQTARQIQLKFNTGLLRPAHDYSGFSVTDSTQAYTIDSIYADYSDSTILNISLKEKLSPSLEVYLNYIPGTIWSEDSIILERINNLKISNTLTETKVTASSVKSDGTNIKLTFNKYLDENSASDGLSVYTKNKSIGIDSIAISMKYLTLFISPEIVRGDSVFADYNGLSITGTDEVPLSGFTKMLIDNTSTITSVAVPGNNKLFCVWPNPNKNGIVFYETDNRDPGIYEIISQNGLILAKGELNTDKGQINLGNHIPEGIYFMKINTQAQIEIHELMIIN